jgi:hypothetical protein
MSLHVLGKATRKKKFVSAICFHSKLPTYAVETVDIHPSARSPVKSFHADRLESPRVSHQNAGREVKPRNPILQILASCSMPFFLRVCRKESSSHQYSSEIRFCCSTVNVLPVADFDRGARSSELLAKLRGSAFGD